MQVKLAVRLRKDSGSPSEARSQRFGFIPIQISSGKGLVVIGPDHGPRVDVEQRTYTTGSGDGRYIALFQYGPGSDGPSAHHQSAHSHEYSPKTLS